MNEFNLASLALIEMNLNLSLAELKPGSNLVLHIPAAPPAMESH